MRCREALKRLNQVSDDRKADQALLQHLAACSECARQAKAEKLLQETLADSAAPDHVDLIDWPEQVRRVEARAARAQTNQPREIPIMSAMKRQLRTKPRLSVGLAAALVILLAVTLIPFKFDQTVGFEVAVAGVNRDLALNEEKLEDLLVRLGLPNVEIAVDGCDVTCNLTVSELESVDDAHMIKLAFEEIGKGDVLVELKEVHISVDGSALKHAAHNVFYTDGDLHDDGKLHQIVIDRLGDDFTGENLLFFTDETGHTVGLTGHDAEGAEHGLYWVSDSGCEEGSINIHTALVGDCLEEHLGGADEGDSHVGIYVSIDTTNLGDHGLYFATEGSGYPHAIHIKDENIVNGRLTDEAVAALEAQGYAVEQSVNEDGKLVIKVTSDDAHGNKVLEYLVEPEAEAEASKEVELPDGYSLEQNYPNPFNPTTMIDYSLPQTEHVTLEVYNINGQKVRTLIDETMPPGNHTVEWDARSDSGDRVASGIYLYRFTAGEISASKKMTLVK